MKKKTKKPTRGEMIAGDACNKCSKCRMCAFGRNKLARRIDAAIRRVVKEAFGAQRYTGGRERIEKKYGVKL